MRAAKVIWSNNGWTLPQGNVDYGVPVNDLNENYRYGLEEFLFNDHLIQHKLGYLDCYRANQIDGVEDVLLFTLTPLPQPRQIIVVGIVRGVEQINDLDKVAIWNNFTNANYIRTIVNPAFQQIEELNNNEPAIGTGVFIANNFGDNIENLPLIQGVAPNGFFVNIRYEQIEIFPEGDEMRINLTNVDPIINGAWRRLTNLYYVNNQALIEEALAQHGLF